jgi:2-desacetyl-2-hydroxyethyl bacteriochlorophyllide A dehydrogenase
VRGRRVVFTGRRQAAWEAFDLPERPGPFEVLVETTWSAVSIGTELAVYTGTHIGFSIPGAAYPRYPHHPGYAATGTVLAVGTEVRDLVPGQAVCLPGRHATHTIWDARQPQLALLPAGLAPDVAALARLYTISLNGVRLGHVALGDAVVVLGAGLIGQCAAQLARLAGGRPVVVADRLPGRLEIARQCGLPDTVDVSQRDLAAAGRELTRGRGFDVVVEATGAPDVVARAFELAADFGRVVLLGSPRGRVELDPYTHIHRPGVTVVGAHERTTPRLETIDSRWTAQRNFDLVLDLLARGDLPGEPLITHRPAAVRAPEVYEALARDPADYLGVVFDWRAT